MTVIKVKKVGEMPEYFREYYKGTENGKYYTKTTFRENVEWHSTSGNGGEPDCPIRKDVKFQILKEN